MPHTHSCTKKKRGEEEGRGVRGPPKLAQVQQERSAEERLEGPAFESPTLSALSQRNEEKPDWDFAVPPLSLKGAKRTTREVDLEGDPEDSLSHAEEQEGAICWRDAAAGPREVLLLACQRSPAALPVCLLSLPPPGCPLRERYEGS